MEDSEALLRFIHKNAAMGVGTLPQALSLPQSRAMTSALQDQLREYRSIAARSQSYAKEKGLFRLEGKEYVMQDGDITNFRFNV